MKISVLFFASLREHLGKDILHLEIPEGASVQKVLNEILRKSELTKFTLCAVNETYVPRDTLLKDGDRLALIPPMAGG